MASDPRLPKISILPTPKPRKPPPFLRLCFKGSIFYQPSSIIMVNIKNPQSNLPPGFRFHPTDEELILHYLRKKVTSKPFPLSIIADVDIYKFDPWDLPCRATFGEKEWYFFSPRDRKYPNGARPNRAAASGYWKATGTDKVIVAPPMAPGGLVAGENIGVKKALVFYKGRPPKGVKTNWIMHEYRLADALNYSNHRTIKGKDGSMRLDDWVLCRIYKKSNSLCSESMVATASDQEQQEEEEAEQFLKETLLPVLRTPPPPPLPPSATTTLKPQKSCSFSNLLEAMDYSMLTSYLIDNPLLDSNAFGAGNLEQSSFINSTVSYSPDVLQNIPPPPPHNMDNRLKRQSSDLYDDFTQQSKKFMVSGSYSNGGNQSDVAQYNFVNQNLFLSPYLNFQG